MLWTYLCVSLKKKTILKVLLLAKFRSFLTKKTRFFSCFFFELLFFQLESGPSQTNHVGYPHNTYNYDQKHLQCEILIKQLTTKFKTLDPPTPFVLLWVGGFEICSTFQFFSWHGDYSSNILLQKVQKKCLWRIF
jgi:hypothetical protein